MGIPNLKCKRIIDGKTYNTETATLLGRWVPVNLPFEESLFKTRHGAYFLYREDETDLDELIEPLDSEKAQTWIAKNCSASVWEAEFGEAPEAGDPEARITLRIPETLHKRIAAIAESRQQSLNAWILRCLEHCAALKEEGSK